MDYQHSHSNASDTATAKLPLVLRVVMFILELPLVGYPLCVALEWLLDRIEPEEVEGHAF